MIKVTFLKAWRMYQPGEVAGFDQDMAAAIVAAGFAKLVDEAEVEGEAKAGAPPPAESVPLDGAAKSKKAPAKEAEASALPQQGAGA